MERELETWPACPGCGKPRMAVCPYCRTSGTTFPLADQRPADEEEPAGEAAAEGGCCQSGCGCSCQTQGEGSPGEGAPGEGSHAPADEAAGEGAAGDGAADDGATGEGPEAEVPLRLCPTCDEPFVPRFLPQCEWCGFQFTPQAAEAAGQGAWPFDTSPADIERANPRVVVAVVATLAFLVGVGLYITFIFGHH